MQTLESRLALAMLGQDTASVLMTDAYKFAMTRAFVPQAEETFYLSFRRHDWYFIPFDLREIVARLCPAAPSLPERAFLRNSGYELTPEMELALRAAPSVWAAPKGSWVREREPILTVTGPSFLASWLEPLLVWLHYPIQVATEAVAKGRRRFVCSSPAEADITRLALTAAKVDGDIQIIVDETGTRNRVRRHAQGLVSAVGWESSRLFEVGMRSANCMSSHKAALVQVAAAGISKSSNLYLAKHLGLTPVGTTGHEHQQRFGGDLDGFRAIREHNGGTPSYLFDTYDATTLGIPAAIIALRERPDLAAAVRFDSGDTEAQLRAFVAAGVSPTFVFMDSMNPTRILRLEDIAEELGIPSARRLYGVGGYLVGRASPSDLHRDRVAAVYKLSESKGSPVMKFSVPDKTSIPGRPIIFRRVLGTGPVGLIGQADEVPPPGYQPLQPGEKPSNGNQRVALSAQTSLYHQHLSALHFQTTTSNPTNQFAQQRR